MKITEKYGLKKPEESDFYNVQDMNDNMDIVDAELSKRVEKEDGKGLSANDFTNEYKEKIDGITVINNTNDEDKNVHSAECDDDGNIIKDTYAKKSIYDDTTISVGRKADTTAGTNSIAFGYNVTASGSYSRAFGCATYNPQFSFNEDVIASGIGSHASGSAVKASGEYSFANGCGYYPAPNIVAYNQAVGKASCSFGGSTIAKGDYSQSFGYVTQALTNQMAIGHFNSHTKALENTLTGTSTGTAFVIGNGAGDSLSNAFRVTGEGKIYATNSSVNTGADYAEYFEWVDGNTDNEDRVGRFVTFDESNPEKIRFANENDYILGIVSGMPSVIGNGDECWKRRYILDEFGRYITEKFEYEEIIGFNEETGEEITETKTGTKWKENPEYDDTKDYKPRAERQEWSAIGMMGVLYVYDDGTCQVNGYCKCADGGIATACERGVDTFRVIERVKDNIIKVVLK